MASLRQVAILANLVMLASVSVAAPTSNGSDELLKIFVEAPSVDTACNQSEWLKKISTDCAQCDGQVKLEDCSFPVALHSNNYEMKCKVADHNPGRHTYSLKCQALTERSDCEAHCKLSFEQAPSAETTTPEAPAVKDVTTTTAAPPITTPEAAADPPVNPTTSPASHVTTNPSSDEVTTEPASKPTTSSTTTTTTTTTEPTTTLTPDEPRPEKTTVWGSLKQSVPGIAGGIMALIILAFLIYIGWRLRKRHQERGNRLNPEI